MNILGTKGLWYFFLIVCLASCGGDKDLSTICSVDVDENLANNPPRILDSKCFRKTTMDQFCPTHKSLKRNHKIFLVDTTDGLNTFAQDYVDSLLDYETTLKQSIEPYTRISLINLNDKETSVGFKPLGSICRPRTGTIDTSWGADVAHKSEGQQFVQGQFNNKFAAPILGLKKILAESTKAQSTLLFEYIRSLTSMPKYKFTKNDYQRRELIIFSDLMQYSEKFKFINICTPTRKNCANFENFYKLSETHIHLVSFNKAKARYLL